MLHTFALLNVSQAGGYDQWGSEEDMCLMCEKHALSYPKKQWGEFCQGERGKAKQEERTQSRKRLEKIASDNGVEKEPLADADVRGMQMCFQYHALIYTDNFDVLKLLGEARPPPR